MHKKIIITMLLALIVMLTQAQPIKVEYEYRTKTLPELMQQYFQMQNVQHLRVTLKGNFNGKRAKLKKVTCSNGAFSEQELLPEFVHFLLVDSVESLDFMAVPYGKDSLHICCFYLASNNQPIFNDTVRMDNMKILMETFTPGDSNDIPVVAYTAGIPIQNGVWFCGLRDSGVEPRKWFEKYGIDGYVFYTIRLEEDTPPDDKMPVYVKIAKKDADGVQE